jgi:hypothetical protein
MSARVDDLLDSHWRELVTAALLGTERRTPPRPPVELVADVVDDGVPVDDAVRMLTTVSAVIAARRAAFVALPAADRLQPPATGEQPPMTPPTASATWRTIVGEWPVLEDEWILTVIGKGLRLAPDVLVAALMRHRNDPVRRARAALAGGPLSAWLIDHVDGLAAANGRTASADAVLSLPDLAIPPELAELTTVDAHTFVSRLIPRFVRGEFGAAHRAVLTNLFARCRPAVLLDTAEALDSLGTTLTIPFAELCRLRHTMLEQLRGQEPGVPADR